MSRLWNKGLTVGLWPHGITLRAAGGSRGQNLAPTYWQNHSQQENAPWESALALLEWVIGSIQSITGPVDVVVSNQYARHLVLPWSSDLNDEREWTAFATARINSLWGDQTKWDVQLDRIRFKRNRVVCAIESDLKLRIRAAQQNAKFKIRSIQSNFTVGFNRSAESVGNGPTVFAVAERDNVTLGAADAGDWHYIRTLPLDRARSDEVSKLAERERILLALPADCSIRYAEAEDSGTPAESVSG